MSFKIFVPFAVAAALVGASGEAFAKGGKNKAMLTGAAAGVAVGAVGTYLLTRPSSTPAPAAVDREPTGSTGYQRASLRENCAVRNVELFDRKGNYVKSEKMRVCQ